MSSDRSHLKSILKHASERLDSLDDFPPQAARLIEELAATLKPSTKQSAPAASPAKPSSDSRLRIWTDGSCAGNPGAGGWACIMVDENGKETESTGGERHTTNNRMELTAAIMALEAVAPGGQAEVNSDSEYVIKGITMWINGWRKKNWITSSKSEVANKDLWQRLGDLNDKRRITWAHVKAHNNDHYNERCDLLAKAAQP